MPDGQLSLADSKDRTTQAGEILSFTYHDGVWRQILTGSDATAPFGINVKTFGATGDGSTDDQAAILNAQTAAIAANAPLIFPGSSVSYRIASDFTATVHCIFRGGILKTDAGVLWTFNEPIAASPNQQIFDATYLTPAEQTALEPDERTGFVFHEDSEQPFACPRWWGTDADAFQQAIDSVTFDSAGKYGTVFVQETNLPHPLYVAYDFTIANCDLTKIARKWHEYSPAGRRQPVRFQGDARLTATGGAWTTEQYMLYLTGVATDAFSRFSSMNLYASFKCRGAMIIYSGYGGDFSGLTVRQSVKVGVDMISCYTTTFDRPKISSSRGIGIRLTAFNSSSLSNAKVNTYGYLDDFWPSPTETIIGGLYDSDIQTPVIERAALIVRDGSGKARFDIIGTEGVYNGWPMLETSSDANPTTITVPAHGMSTGDFVRYDGTIYAITKATDDSFTVARGQVIDGLLYRVASAITKANPGVVTCNNHGFATGQRIRIYAPTGMTELNENDYWVSVLSDHTFKLIDLDDGVTELDTSGFVDPGDGTEYFRIGYPSVCVVAGRLQTWSNVRNEGNETPFESVLLTDDCREIKIDGIVNTVGVPPENLLTLIGNQVAITLDNYTHTGVVNTGAVIRGHLTSGKSQKLIQVGVGHSATSVVTTFDWDDGGGGTHYGNTVRGTEIERTVWSSGLDEPDTPTVRMTEKSAYPWHKFTLEGWAENVTDFLNGYDGQEITVFIADNAGPYAIEHDDTKIDMADGMDLTPNVGDVLGFKLDGTVWRQTFYQNNSPKAKLTTIGGLAVLLTNRTGVATVAGTVVVCGGSNDGFEANDIDGDQPMGIVLDDGVANGSEAWVVVSGIADVLLEDGTGSVRGYWAKSGDSTAGRADMTNADPPAMAHASHAYEIGHCIESKGSGTDVLARCVLHFT